MVASGGVIWYHRSMKNNPFFNALLAVGYIVLVVLVMSTFADSPVEQKVPLFVPMVLLSLLTLSVAVMGYLFVYQPLCLYLDGAKKEAVKLFLRTTGIFAGITALGVFALFLLK